MAYLTDESWSLISKINELAGIRLLRVTGSSTPGPRPDDDIINATVDGLSIHRLFHEEGGNAWMPAALIPAIPIDDIGICPVCGRVDVLFDTHDPLDRGYQERVRADHACAWCMGKSAGQGAWPSIWATRPITCETCPFTFRGEACDLENPHDWPLGQRGLFFPQEAPDGTVILTVQTRCVTDGIYRQWCQEVAQ